MTALAEHEEIFVETHARLHFGVLDLHGALGRWFGGLGTAAPAPVLRLSARRASTLVVEGEDAARAEEFSRRFLEFHRITTGAHVTVHQMISPHAGLGSGTQLGLAVARALAAIHDRPTDASALARAVGRAQRSAIGTWTFAGGGLVVEGGRRRDDHGCGPLIARVPFPPSWRCVLAVPRGRTGLSGLDEDAAFARLPPASQRDAEHVAHVVLMALLPALVDGDLPSFGAALANVQAVTGRWFASVQGGVFAPGPSEELVRRFSEWGAHGVGQSSWGPAVYGIVDSAEHGARLADRARQLLNDDGDIYEGPFLTDGARVWRTPASADAARTDAKSSRHDHLIT